MTNHRWILSLILFLAVLFLIVRFALQLAIAIIVRFWPLLLIGGVVWWLVQRSKPKTIDASQLDPEKEIKVNPSSNKEGQ
jgi:predicted membrane protein